jgi:2-hydroxy-3-keto-5-methylthiopentenyl-1-phosphate phosphatase
MPLDPTRLHVFTDFDGTITTINTLMFLGTRLGAGPFPEAAMVLRAEVPIDPAFAPFARWCAAKGMPLTVLSAGFEEIVALYVTPEEFPGVEVRANRLWPGTWHCCFRDDSPYGHDKAAALREAQTHGRQTVLIGDGTSDEAPVFARRGRPLVRHCRGRGIPCHEYESFHDVLQILSARPGRAA